MRPVCRLDTPLFFTQNTHEIANNRYRQSEKAEFQDRGVVKLNTAKCIRAKIIYSGKDVLKNRYLVFDENGIVGVKAKPEGRVVGECAVLTPAFIDPHSHIGVHRHGDPGAECESNDTLDSIQPLPDVLDSIQMDDVAFRMAAECGTLYSCVMPGSANIIGGLSAVVRHDAPHTTAALIARAGLKAALGYNVIAYGGKGTRPSTRRGAVAILRARLNEVRSKTAKISAKQDGAAEQKDGATELNQEEQALKSVLDGETILRVHAHKTDDIAALLRLVDEFKLRVSVEHAGDVCRPEIFVELRRRGITVVFGPVDSYGSKVELKNKNWRNSKVLLDSGVDFCVMTDHPVTHSWSQLQQTRFLLRCGLGKQAALESITRKSADFLGIGDRLGTLEKGKWASFVCWSGDPFDIASYPVAVYMEGRQLL